MKNIEFYYDDLVKCESFDEIINFMFSIDVGFKGEIDMPLFITWLNEEHTMLTFKEREYLSSVIKPFRKNAKYIIKCSKDYISFIKILMIDDDNITLPYFNEEDMYLGMEPNEAYSLEELGL